MTHAVAALREIQPSFMRWTAGGVMLIEGLTFLTAASLHLGARIQMGSMMLDEPAILPAARVEIVCGLGLVGAAVVLLSQMKGGWLASMVAHLLAAGGVLLGMAALAAGRGPRTASNDAYHLTILIALVTGAALLATPPVRVALRR
ncbi:MAG: hypothetical protein AB7P40_21825 [Chloroflexota bacterium]